LRAAGSVRSLEIVLYGDSPSPANPSYVTPLVESARGIFGEPNVEIKSSLKHAPD